MITRRFALPTKTSGAGIRGDLLRRGWPCVKTAADLRPDAVLIGGGKPLSNELDAVEVEEVDAFG
jgi:hypothetical protein